MLVLGAAYASAAERTGADLIVRPRSGNDIHMDTLRAWRTRGWLAGLATATLAASACGGTTTRGGGTGDAPFHGTGGSGGSVAGAGTTGIGAGGGSVATAGTTGSSVASASSTGSGGVGGSVASASSTGSGGGCGEGGLTVLAAGLPVPSAIAVDGTDVYWVNGATGNPSGGDLANGSVMKCAVGGCNGQPTTLATGQPAPDPIALDGTYVYWGNLGIDGYGTDGSLMRCSKTGCGQAPTQLFSGAGPSGLAVTGGSAYWLTTGNGTGTVFGCTLPGCTPQGSPR